MFKICIHNNHVIDAGMTERTEDDSDLITRLLSQKGGRWMVKGKRHQLILDACYIPEYAKLTSLLRTRLRC